MKDIEKSDLDFFRKQINDNPNIDDEFKQIFSEFLDEIKNKSKKGADPLKYILGAKALIEIFDKHIKEIFENWNSV